MAKPAKATPKPTTGRVKTGKAVKALHPGQETVLCCKCRKPFPKRALNRNGMCLECGIHKAVQNIRQQAAKRGPFYNRKIQGQLAQAEAAAAEIARRKRPRAGGVR